MTAHHAPPCGAFVIPATVKRSPHMTTTAPAPNVRFCRTCSTELLPHEGRGRPAAFCTVECQRAARASDARARRAGTLHSVTVDTTEADAYLARVDAELAARAAAVERLRPRFEAGDFGLLFDVATLTVEERTALVDLLDEREGAARAASYYSTYDDGTATYVDVAIPCDDDEDADGSPVALGDPLGDYGFTGVGPGKRRGTSSWSSDYSLDAQKRHTALEASELRAACIADAIRDARSDARFLGVLELDDEALATARAVGNAKADHLLAALA